MPLNIKNDQAHLLARELAELMHESITEAVTTAIREAIARRKQIQEKQRRTLINKLKEIADFTAGLPVYDSRTPDEILGYDQTGLPGSW